MSAVILLGLFRFSVDESFELARFVGIVAEYRISNRNLNEELSITDTK